MRRALAACLSVPAIAAAIVAGAACGGTDAASTVPVQTRAATPDGAAPIPGVPRLRTQAEIDEWAAPRSGPGRRPVIIYSCDHDPRCANFDRMVAGFLRVMDDRGEGEARTRTAWATTTDIPDWPYARALAHAPGAAVVYLDGEPNGQRLPIPGRLDWQRTCNQLYGLYTNTFRSVCPMTPPRD